MVIDAPPAVWAPGRRQLTAGLVLTVTLVAFESLAVSTVMPAVADDLGGLGLYGWVFSGFFLGSLVGIVLAGTAADRRTLSPPYAAGLLLFGAGLLVGGLAPSMPVLVAARVGQGIGAGAIPAVAYTSVGRAYPLAIQARVFAVFSTAWVVPGLIGPATASAIAEAASWRWVFLSLLPLVAAAAAITLPALRAVTDGVAPAADRDGVTRSAIVLALGAALVVGGLSAGAVVPAVVLVVLGAPIAGTAFVQLVPPGTATVRPGLPAAVAVRGLLTFAFFATDSFVPLVMTDVRDQPGWVAGAALTATTLSWTAAAWVQQRAIHTAGPRRLVGAGFVLVAVGIGGALLCLTHIPVPLGIALFAIAGFGTGLAYAPLSVTVLATADPGEQGTATAGLQLTDVLGVALGTGATGAFVAVGEAAGWTTRASLVPAFALAATVALTGMALARRLPVRI